MIVVIVVFRASLDMPGWGIPPDYAQERRAGEVPVSRWSTAIWGAASLYALYRAVNWGASNGDLPLGGCLVVEAALVPMHDDDLRRLFAGLGTRPSCATRASTRPAKTISISARPSP